MHKNFKAIISYDARLPRLAKVDMFFLCHDPYYRWVRRLVQEILEICWLFQRCSLKFAFSNLAGTLYGQNWLIIELAMTNS